MGPKHAAPARLVLWVAVTAALGPNVACVSSTNPGVKHPVTLSVAGKQQDAGVCRVFISLINTGANEVTIPFSPRAFDAKGTEVAMEPWREDEKPSRELKRTTESYAWQAAPLRVSVERVVRFIQDDPLAGARQTVQAMVPLDPSFSGPKASFHMAGGVRVMAEMVWMVVRCSFENTGGAPTALPLASLHLRSDQEDLEPAGFAEAGQVSLASRLEGKVAVAARSASTKTLIYRSHFLWPDRYVLACR